MPVDRRPAVRHLGKITCVAAVAALCGCAAPAIVPAALEPVVVTTPIPTPAPAQASESVPPTKAASADTTSPNRVAQQGYPLGTPVGAGIPAAIAPAPRDSGTPDSVAVDVARSAMDVFGDSAPVVVKTDGVSAPTWDIDVHSYETTSRVEYYVQYFSGPAKDRIVERLGRGTRYEPMIRQQMREGGIPEDMYYLALIESGFDPNAYSKAAAVGMWQFMTSTARDMGLRVDWWVDERRDPVRSTGAAVRFIKGLRDQFGRFILRPRPTTEDRFESRAA